MGRSLSRRLCAHAEGFESQRSSDAGNLCRPGGKEGAGKDANSGSREEALAKPGHESREARIGGGVTCFMNADRPKWEKDRGSAAEGSCSLACWTRIPMH